jgi:APA family basic amino acid/polyamine antiporter
MMGFGNIIGSGIFVLTGIAAQYAGPAVFLSFLISGVVSILTAFSFAELAARMPYSGSSYVYVYSTFGEFLGWIVGWGMNLRCGVTAAA